MYIKPDFNQQESERNSMFIEYVHGYLDKDIPLISNLSNFSALVFDFFDQINWAGFYLYDGEKLYLGPFQGKPACTEIAFGKGVCGSALKLQKTLVVDDTSLFEGHITCDEASKSEIVIPIVKDGLPFGVLDIDSPVLNRFSEEDQIALEKAIHLLIDIL